MQYRSWNRFRNLRFLGNFRYRTFEVGGNAVGDRSRTGGSSISHLYRCRHDSGTGARPQSGGGHPESEREGFIEGFLIAFLNPKIFVFLTAIFSQFIDAGMILQDRLILAFIALFIDTTWYIIVATTLSGTPMLEKLRDQGKKVDIAVGVILLLLAAAIVWARLV